MQHKPLYIFKLLENFFSIKGPTNWQGYCQTGKSQSPIDIQTRKLEEKTFQPFIFKGYDKLPKKLKLTNNGHTVQANLEESHGQIVPSVSPHLRHR